MLWKVLKDSNPEVLCFYEPCHPKISDLLQAHPIGAVNELHEDVLFDEYHQAFENPVPAFQDGLSRTKVYPDSFEQIRERISKFVNTDKDIILQTNRWHFHLMEIHAKYGCSLMHTLRNPFHVWDSVQRGIREQGRLLYELRRIAMNRSLGDFFGSNSIYLTAQKVHPHPEPLLATSFERFIAGWVISNYYAVNAVRSAGGTILTYESILASAGNVLDALSSDKLQWHRHASIRRKEVKFLEPEERAQLAAICKRFKIDDLFHALLEMIGE